MHATIHWSWRAALFFHWLFLALREFRVSLCMLFLSPLKWQISTWWSPFRYTEIQRCESLARRPNVIKSILMLTPHSKFPSIASLSSVLRFWAVYIWGGWHPWNIGVRLSVEIHLLILYCRSHARQNTSSKFCHKDVCWASFWSKDIHIRRYWPTHEGSWQISE